MAAPLRYLIGTKRQGAAKIRRFVYDFLCRVRGIEDRYLSFRQSHSFIKSVLYLIWLNLRYYLLFDRRLKRELLNEIVSPINLNPMPESSLYPKPKPKALLDKLLKYDVIAFDMFDTLVLRPFSKPEDLFYALSVKLGYPALRELRVEAEKEARLKNREAGLLDIWQVLSANTGIYYVLGMALEKQLEKALCTPNPYMLKVFKMLIENNKTVIVMSDMYLDPPFLQSLLNGLGFYGIKKLYVSSGLGLSKSGGGMYSAVKKEFPKAKSFVMVGDNPHSDIDEAKKHGFDTYYYPGVNSLGKKYRCKDMSKFVGSIYRGLVNSRIYNGLESYSLQYEYGYIYGGLFVTGYCKFIHEYAKSKGIQKLLFLSRDGALLLKAYKLIYPDDDNACYTYWSRYAALKLCADYFKDEYFERFLFLNTHKGITISALLDKMELSPLKRGAQKFGADTRLTHKNAPIVKKYLLEHWDEVLSAYSGQQKAAAVYFDKLLNGVKSAAAVDIGWAGSGAVMLDYAVNNVFGMDCPVTGILAAGAGASDLKADRFFTLFINGKLVSYLFSQYHNRDLYKFHSPAKLYNLYWELLLGAPHGGLYGFYPDGDGAYKLKFKDKPAWSGSITQIHNGACDFVRDFIKVEQSLGFDIPISGRDAYAPMVNFLADKNRRLRNKLKELLDNADVF